MNIQISNLDSLDRYKKNVAQYHYLFPMVLAGKHSFRIQELNSFQLDLKERIEVISSPSELFPRLEDINTDIQNRIRVNVLAQYFWSQLEEELGPLQKKEGKTDAEIENLASKIYLVLWESVHLSILSDFQEMLEEPEEYELEQMTAKEVVAKMHEMLVAREEGINEAKLLKDLESYVDQSETFTFRDGTYYFWIKGEPRGGIVMVNAKFDYMVALTGNDLD